MSRDKIDLTKEPEVYVDGQKATFHYSRKERLAKMPKRINVGSSFFSRKNRYIHIIILDIVLVMIIGIIFSVIVGRAKIYNEAGFKYSFAKKYFTDSPNLDFTMQIKNVSKKNNILENIEIELQILDKKNIIIFNKIFNIPKQLYKPDEFYQENIIIDKPKKGDYKAIVHLGTKKNKKIELKFSVK
ncbi:MAG: hypothetical protein KAT05_13655 [Spirochaetes bacterium]|nr:hypothetical protein [Spirochaetota bacterium]